MARVMPRNPLCVPHRQLCEFLQLALRQRLRSVDTVEDHQRQEMDEARDHLTRIGDERDEQAREGKEAADRLEKVVDEDPFSYGRNDRQQVGEQSHAVELRVSGQVACGGRRIARHQDLRSDERLGKHSGEDDDQIKRSGQPGLPFRKGYRHLGCPLSDLRREKSSRKVGWGSSLQHGKTCKLCSIFSSAR